MDRVCEVFRNSVIRAFPRNGRKMWVSLLLDIRFIELGIKKALLFDYADVTTDKLETLLFEIEEGCPGFISSGSLMVVRIGQDNFILNYTTFSSHLAECVRRCCMPCGEKEEYYIIIDVSNKSSSPIELGNLNEIKKLRISLLTMQQRIKDIKEGSLNSKVLLEETKDVCFSSIYGILLNYPVVYWFNSESTNLAGEAMFAYKLKVRDKELFGIKVPKNYTVMSFTAPQCIDHQQNISYWETSIRNSLKSNCIEDNFLLPYRESTTLFKISL